TSVRKSKAVTDQLFCSQVSGWTKGDTVCALIANPDQLIEKSKKRLNPTQDGLVPWVLEPEDLNVYDKQILIGTVRDEGPEFLPEEFVENFENKSKPEVTAERIKEYIKSVMKTDAYVDQVFDSYFPSQINTSDPNQLILTI